MNKQVKTTKTSTKRAKPKPAANAPSVPDSLPTDAGADTLAKPKRPFYGKSNLPRDADGKIITSNKNPKIRGQHPREAILRAFERLGGRRWLVKLGKQYPKEFASLLARMVPNEVNVSGTVGYAPLAIPVEVREPIPGVCVDITPPVPVELDPFT